MAEEIIKGSTSQGLPFLLVSNVDHLNGQTGKTPTVTIRKEGGLFAPPAGSIVELGNGHYEVAPNAANYDTLGILILHAEASGCDPVDRYFEIKMDPRGPGAAEAVIVVKDNSSVVIPGAQVWLTTGQDSQDGFVAGPLTTDAFGRVTFLVDPSLGPAMNVTDASNATPIVITTSTSHGLTTGDRVVVENVLGNTAANGEWVITVLGATTFELDDSAGNGAYTSGGNVRTWGAYYRWVQKSGYRFQNPQPVVVP